jgi:short-subunit dehydrogenase
MAMSARAAARALVTGASRGIGRAIAKALAERGLEVTGTSRDPAGMAPGDRIAGVRYLPLDVRDERSIAALAAEAGELDVLVNNAGGSQIGALEEVSLDKVRGLFDSNLFGLLKLTQLLLPGMRGRRRGLIVNVASFAGVTPVPFLSVYAASKAALIALSRGLRHEVAPWGIKVAVVAPFDIHTSIPLEIGHLGASAYQDALARVRAVRDRGLAEAPEPDVVGRKVLQILDARRPRFLYPVGRGATVSALLVKVLPERAVEAVVRRRYDLKAGFGQRRT